LHVSGAWCSSTCMRLGHGAPAGQVPVACVWCTLLQQLMLLLHTLHAWCGAQQCLQVQVHAVSCRVS
jgi:succinate dehydrogenase hydrophobic anchor subunit